MYACLGVDVCACARVHVYACARRHACNCMYVSIRTVCVRACVCMCMYVCVHIHTCICMYTITYSRTFFVFVYRYMRTLLADKTQLCIHVQIQDVQSVHAKRERTSS